MVTVAGLSVGGAGLEEWGEVVEWAAEEGWNPGGGDAACFHPTDPGGFFVGRVGGRIVSAVSVVNYSAEYAFLGYYMVRSGMRRGGLGLATWRAAVPHAGERTIGLDGVPAQQETYERAGFTAAYRNLRYAGRPTRPAPGSGALDGAPRIEPADAAPADAVATYDRRCFPADRRHFVGRWLAARGHIGYAALRDGQVSGYGVIRPARDGMRIGPLFADGPLEAEALFDALIGHLPPDGQVTLDIPEVQEEAVALAERRGLVPVSHTVRMYAGQAPETGPGRTYGVTSLELG
ncbi:GNAT family N-acetyltransferase [Streptomyces sp. ODS28]|uniref:GNAT family N-acetyltransferase n=1 Tax=Streptomyces sp. ODS28 TaxID=3136688 RepID=UPI0031F135E1